ncbi:MAG TPA: DNA repair protein RecN [Spirochaetota bacterium]|nr:DNA repair protein RecN [Spirochaetota bacterium]
MLRELRIKNFVLIEDLKLDFGNGLNILTGETGAGKSILIDALSGVLGDKMTTDMIRTGFDRAILEGEFDIAALPQVPKILEESGIDCDDSTLVLRRELFANGKGRCFANASQIPVAKLKEISEYLVDIHGQNEHQNIGRIAKHREILDSFGGHQESLDAIYAVYHTLQDLKEKIGSHQIDEKEKARRIEYLSHALREIETAKLQPGEEEELKNESTLLANAEKLFTEINTASSLMKGDGGILPSLKKVEQSLSVISEYDAKISDILDVVQQSLYSLDDISGVLRDYHSGFNFSPQRLNEVEERLSLISSLKKKYGDSIQEIADYAERSSRELEAISTSEEEIENLTRLYKETVREAKEIALDLSEKRKASAKNLEEKVMQELKDLGMGGTSFRISIKRELSPDGEIESENKKYVLYPHGLDRVEFLIAANEGEDLKQLRKVASGGEMSRIMLALKNVILSADIVDSLIFDEVDAGIGGKTAEIVGRKLKSLSKNRQVLVITHLPQIAAMSDFHYTVQKEKINERTTTNVKKLAPSDKIREIARMLSGEKVTDLTMRHAEEMVSLAEGTP